MLSIQELLARILRGLEALNTLKKVTTQVAQNRLMPLLPLPLWGEGWGEGERC